MEGLAQVCLAVGGAIALLNWLMVWLSYRTQRFHSAVPLFGGALLGVGLFLLPATRPYAWAALFLDWGTLVVLLALPYVIHEFWATSRWNLVHAYVGQCGRRSVRLCLYRRGVFVIRLTIERPAGEFGMIGTGNIGQWERSGTRLMLSIGGESATFDFLPDAVPETLRQVTGFPSFEADPETSLHGMDLTRQESTAE